MPMSQSPHAFCDINAVLGCPSRGIAQFSSTTELLSHLDRLGVSRAFVSHIGARDISPTWGNRALLTALEQDTNARQRLFPCFVAGTATLHEHGALAELLSLFQNYPHASLRLYPNSLNHRLEHLVPLFEALDRLAPVVLVDFEEIHDPKDLITLARRFPHRTFICTRAAWSDLSAVHHLLAGQPNIGLDLSWVHTCGTIEQLVEKFGHHRLFFGLGPRSNGGAGIAGVCDARLSASNREAIASGNISALLQLPPPPSSPNLNPDRLWSRFLRGDTLGLDIIDAHGHLGPVGTWMLPLQQIEPQIHDMTSRMERAGIKTMVVSGTHALFGDCLFGNRLLEDHAAPFPQFRGYLVFNPHHADLLAPHIENFFARDFFVGFKLLSSYWQVPVTDPRYDTVWRYAHRHRLPILLHTWFDDYDLPMMLDDIASRYPDASFLLGHSGGTDAGRASALELAKRHQNVYLEWCGCYRMTRPYEELISILGPHRFVFGTDAALHSPAWELGRFLSLDLPDEMLFPALGANMRRILAARAA